LINLENSSRFTEQVSIVSGNVLTETGLGFFGMEQTGLHTILWVDNTTSLTATNITIGGRHSATITSPLYISFINASVPVPVTRFYDTQTGLLLGFDIALNLTGSGGFPAPAQHEATDASALFQTDGAVGVEQGSIFGSTPFAITVVISSTNIVSYAWNPGGELTLWLFAAGTIIGLSLLFGVLIYARKK
jgi:hypothetical protein